VNIGSSITPTQPLVMAQTGFDLISPPPGGLQYRWLDVAE
jgi:hypothetical protein